MKPFYGSLMASTVFHLAFYGTALGIIVWNEAHAAFRMDVDQSNAPLLTLAPQNPPEPETWILAKKAVPQPTPQVQPTPTPEASTAAMVGRQPSWVGGFINEEDYPAEMRRQNKEGRVIVEVLIDVTGSVKAVSIIQGAEPQFNDLVMEKLKDAKFRPALDQTGQPMNCRVRLPIAFKLND